MAVRADVIITAGLRPELFAGRGVLSNSRTLVFAALVVLILAGFGFRATGLSAEGLSEDELNKLNAVADYRANGLTGANGEHPMLMKGLQAATIIIAERWNNSSFAASRPASRHLRRGAWRVLCRPCCGASLSLAVNASLHATPPAVRRGRWLQLGARA